MSNSSFGSDEWLKQLELIEDWSPLEAKKGGVSIFHSSPTKHRDNVIDFGPVDLRIPPEQVQQYAPLIKPTNVPVKVHFALGKTDSKLHFVSLFPHRATDSPFLVSNDESNDTKTTAIIISINPLWLELGFHEQTIVFGFKKEAGPFYNRKTTEFCITRKIRMQSVYVEDIVALKADAAPFIPKALKTFFTTHNVTQRATVPPTELSQNVIAKFDEKIAPYDFVESSDTRREKALACLNAENRERLKLVFDDKSKLKEFQRMLKSSSTSTTSTDLYTFGFTKLLQMEEAQMRKDIERYDLFNVSLTVLDTHHNNSNTTRVQLVVPGATENRPQLLYGDVVLLRPTDDGSKEIQARVVEKHRNVVTLLMPVQYDTKLCIDCKAHVVETQCLPCTHSILCTKCAAKFQFLKSYLCPECNVPVSSFTVIKPSLDILSHCTTFHIRFQYNRLGFRLMYDCLSKISSTTAAANRIFPSNKIAVLQESQQPNNNIQYQNPKINERQGQAVKRVLSEQSISSAPVIIYGPPGTGKTCTVIESILQVLVHKPNSKILATAPSDTAADILTERLAAALSPSELYRFNWYHRALASVPPSLLQYCSLAPDSDVFEIPSTIQNFSVVVSTCVLSGLLSSKDGGCEFDYVFIDEAAQATEPESMVPISVAKSDAVIVLGGDPKQLGCTLRSATASSYGLGVSYQERLMKRDSCGDDNVIKLVNNYRSHAEILRLPSDLFYESELVPCATEEEVSALANWERSEFPLLFYGVMGKDFHELDSPSYFNPTEASQVANLIVELLSSSNVSVSAADIGVITPFRQQVLQLRRVLRSRGLGSVNVGAVEHFQGQEAKIIIISTVLSHTLRKDEEDAAAIAGIIGDPKRFNVALTRAKALVIVVGHPEMLAQDPLWKKLMHRCVDNDAVQGCAASVVSVNTDRDTALAETIDAVECLGSGRLSDTYPSSDDWLQHFYLDDPEWRLAL